MDTMKDILWANSEDEKVLTSAHIWKDKNFEKYADATVIMGDRTWKIHRCIVCSQSNYFEKALEGGFMESAIKEIDLTGNPFTADEVHHLLVFIYTGELDYFYGRQTLDIYALGDYFQVDRLRNTILKLFYRRLEHFANIGMWKEFEKLVWILLDKYPSGDVRKIVVEVIAKNIHVIIQLFGGTLWKQFRAAQPKLAEKILKVRFPRNWQSLQESDRHMHTS